MNKRVHLLLLNLSFPAGLAAGAGGDFNTLRIARNGVGEPVLRGTSLAGVLRHAYSRSLGANTKSDSEQVRRYFGHALDDKAECPSTIRVADCVLNVGQSSDALIRTHHLRSRHTRAVVDGGLFALECCPPGTTAQVSIWFHEPNNTSIHTGDFTFLQAIVSLLNGGLTVGGSAARGIGRIELSGPAKIRTFELSDLDQHAIYLETQRSLRIGGKLAVPGLETMENGESVNQQLDITLKLGVPRGQDFLVADGQGNDHETEPQRVHHVDGHEYWRIPGSTFRGLFRAWMTKLAAKEGLLVADSYMRQENHRSSKTKVSTDEINGENLGRCFLPKDEGADPTHPPKIDCPIASLFGSVFSAGRIHFSDALSLKGSAKSYTEQIRMHVAVDRITGGAAESMLFDNTVLVATDSKNTPSFEVKIRVTDPTEHEVQWLRKTILALDLGLLRLGSSKSAGRIELQIPPTATGPLADQLTSIIPQRNR